METIEIKHRYHLLVESLERIDRDYMDTTHQAISNLPKNEQAEFWTKYNMLDQYIDSNFAFIQELVAELALRKTKKESEYLQNQVKVYRAYIIAIGGNPSNCNFSKTTD